MGLLWLVLPFPVSISRLFGGQRKLAQSALAFFRAVPEAKRKRSVQMVPWSLAKATPLVLTFRLSVGHKPAGWSGLAFCQVPITRPQMQSARMARPLWGTQQI